MAHLILGPYEFHIPLVLIIQKHILVKMTIVYIPSNIVEYPAIGHDRRYDNLNKTGILALITDSRAIGADWKFVSRVCNSINASRYKDAHTGFRSWNRSRMLGLFQNNNETVHTIRLYRS